MSDTDDWSKQYQHKKNPYSLMLEALPFVIRREAALDLGCGNLVDAKYLRRNGFEYVVGVDSTPEVRDFAIPEIELHIAPIQKFRIPVGRFDFISCCNTLYFIPKEDTEKIFSEVASGLRYLGMFTCNVIGERDESVTTGRTLHGQKVFHFTRREASLLCRNFEIVDFESREKDDKAVGSDKTRHWHTYRMILRKKR